MKLATKPVAHRPHPYLLSEKHGGTKAVCMCLGIAFGSAFGAVFGVLMGNLSIGIAVGTGLGTGLGIVAGGVLDAAKAKGSKPRSPL